MRLLRGFLCTVDLRSESGLALELILGVLLFFSVVTVAVTTMTRSTQSTASLSTAHQSAYALAMSGLNNALAALEDTPTNDPENPNLLGSASSPVVTTTSTGSVAFYGVFDQNAMTWSLSSTSTVPSPVSGRGAVHVTLEQQVTLTATLSGDWNRIYQADASKCLTVPDQVDIPGNVTAQGNLCLNGGSITGAGTTVEVGGTTTLTPQAKSSTNTSQPAGTGSGSGWTNLQNITAQDNAVATASIAANSDGPVLTASNFGFSIPSNATINGISVKFVRWASSNSPSCCIEAPHVYIVKNGIAGGTDHSDNKYWPNKSGAVTFGSTSDLWGQTWTPADVDSSSFGVQFATHNYSTSAAVTASVDYVQITVTYTPPADDASIGTSSTPVKEADLKSTCNYNAQGAHSPCTSADHVWAGYQTQNPPNLSKPSADFSYWYTKAAPGPMHGCDVQTGTPPVFDNNPPNYDNSDGDQKIAGGSVASYTCISKDANGNVIGQLSWDATTQVLTISGVVFIDGEADFGSGPGASVIHYQGRGAIYAPGGSHIDVPVCAGGTGSVSCETTGMSNWDPTQNLLVLVVGDKEPAGNNDCKIDETTSAFQGVYWSKNTCDMAAGAEISGPIIANDLSISNGHVSSSTPASVFYPWPKLGAILPGVNAGAASYAYTLGPVTGG